MQEKGFLRILLVSDILVPQLVVWKLDGIAQLQKKINLFVFFFLFVFRSFAAFFLHFPWLFCSGGVTN